jgi:hypothetical protein
MQNQYRLRSVLSLIVCMIVGAAANADAGLTLAPFTQTVAPGSTFSVDVNISGAADLYGFQFDVLFDPNIVAAVSSSEGSFLSQGGSTFFIPGTNDNAGGTVAATANTLISPVPGVTGSGNLAVLTFEALKSGFSSLAISGVELIDSAFNSIGSQTAGGSITVGSGQGMSAPEIDPGSAISALTLLLGGLAVLRAPQRRIASRSGA